MQHKHALSAGGGLIAMFGPIAWPSPPSFILWGGIAVGALLFLYGGLGFLREKAWMKLVFRSWGFIPLREAARIAYEKTRHTATGKAIEQFSKDGANDVLTHYYYALTQPEPVQLFGRRLPSRKREQIPEKERKYLDLGSGLDSLNDRYKNHPVWSEIEVKRSDLKRKIQEILGWSSTPDI